MSVWSTTQEIKAKKYEGSHIDPRRPAVSDSIDIALVADYVYLDSGNGDRVLPWLRLSVGAESILLNERAAFELAEALNEFGARPKWRARP